MVKFISTKQFDKSYENLSKSNQERIIEKLKYLSSHPNIFVVIKKLDEFKNATHRIRIANFRIVLNLVSETKEEITFFLIKVGHRREIYR